MIGIEGIVKQALLRAMDLHSGQSRKDGTTPYVVHPIQAAMIIARAGSDDATIAAALLHDTVEDTPYTFEELFEEFGESITEMVRACSEDKRIADWDERKNELFARLEQASIGAKLVKAADVMANMLDLKTALVRTNGDFWKKFHATPEQKIVYFQGVFERTKDILPSHMRQEYEKALMALTS